MGDQAISTSVQFLNQLRANPQKDTMTMLLMHILEVQITISQKLDTKMTIVSKHQLMIAKSPALQNIPKLKLIWITSVTNIINREQLIFFLNFSSNSTLFQINIHVFFLDTFVNLISF